MAKTAQYVGASALLGAGGVALGMSGIGPLVFASAAAPAMMGAGGAALPGLWWLMNTVPPKPRVIDFPAIRLLFNLVSDEKQSASVPLWQRLLRLGAVAAVVTGLADPQFESKTALEKGSGPVLLVVDNSWDSAKSWPLVRQRMDEVLASAARQGRSVMVLPTASPAAESSPVLQSAQEARSALVGLEPRPWPADRAAAMKAIDSLGPEAKGSSVLWFSNGQDDPRVPAFIQTLQGVGPLSVFRNAPSDAAHILSLKSGDQMGVTIRRLDGTSEERQTVIASAASGDVLAQMEAHFAPGDFAAEAVFDLPPELRRQITKISLVGEQHAGATLLLDESWRKRSVGILQTTGKGSLLEDVTFIKPAIENFTDLHMGGVEDILKKPLSVVVMTDQASVGEEESRKLGEWVSKGGMLLRFAGPRLAAQPEDSLTPLPLLPGESHTKGDLSGSKASSLLPFEAGSPFEGLSVPQDLDIRTRVLPEAGAGEQSQVWAAFEDGVPFISAKRQGDGWIVLVHTTANLEWSNLPLADDLFLEMMKSVISRSKSAGAQAELNKPLPPLSIMDAQGKLGASYQANVKLSREHVKEGIVGPLAPPGFYGEGALSRLAHNLYSAVKEYKPAGALPGGVSVHPYQDKQGPDDLKGAMLALAISLLLADLMARLKQNGALPNFGASSRAPVREPQV